jgi:hypothetical protein
VAFPHFPIPHFVLTSRSSRRLNFQGRAREKKQNQNQWQDLTPASISCTGTIQTAALQQAAPLRGMMQRFTKMTTSACPQETPLASSAVNQKLLATLRESYCEKRSNFVTGRHGRHASKTPQAVAPDVESPLPQPDDSNHVQAEPSTTDTNADGVLPEEDESDEDFIVVCSDDFEESWEVVRSQKGLRDTRRLLALALAESQKEIRAAKTKDLQARAMAYAQRASGRNCL